MVQLELDVHSVLCQPCQSLIAGLKKDEFDGVAAFDPSTECQGKHDLTLEKSKAQDGH